MVTTTSDLLKKMINGAVARMEDPWEFVITEPPKILIVEDDPQLAELIGTLLKSNWFDCVIRRSGTQGVSSFMKDPVDLIITDLRMSAGDGVTLIETIRRISDAPVIIVTGFASEYADRVRYLNNVALLHKPFETAALLRLVDKALDTGNKGTTDGWNASESGTRSPKD